MQTEPPPRITPKITRFILMCLNIDSVLGHIDQLRIHIMSHFKSLSKMRVASQEVRCAGREKQVAVARCRSVRTKCGSVGT